MSLDHARRTELLTEIIRIQGMLTESHNARELCAPLLDVLIEFSESEIGFIGEVLHGEDGAPYLKTHAISNIAWNAATEKIYRDNSESGFEFRNLQSLFGAVLTTGDRVIANRPAEDLRRGGLPDGHPPLSCFLGLPIQRQGEMVGMVGVANRPGGYTAEICEVLQPVLDCSAFILQAFRTAAERAQFAARLQKSEAMLRGILDAAADAIVAINTDGIIVSANAAVETLLGYQPGELLGSNISALMPEDVAAAHDEYIRDYLKSGSSRIIGVGREVVARHRDGSQFPVALSVSQVQHGDSILFTGVMHDIRSRRRAERERFNAYSQLASVLEACSQVSVIATDVNGTITLFNRGAEQMLGYSADQIVGRCTPVRFHLTEEVAEQARLLSSEFQLPVEGFRALVKRADTEACDRREWTWLRSDGTHIKADVTVVSVRDADNKITGYLGVAIDVTGRSLVQQELINARDAAEAASRAKSEFVANISHEIRTPLNGILGMEQLLLQTSLTPEQREYVTASRGCAESLLNVINEVLDYSRIEAGHLESHQTLFNPAQMISDALQPHRFAAEEKGLVFTINIDSKLPEQILADEGHIRQVLLNLTGNAFKFTPEGSVTVDVTADGFVADKLLLQIDVQDTGIGIPAEMQSEVFEPFVLSDTSNTRRFGGTGLGLTLSRRFVELMGGRIWLESTVGQGSAFHFTVPARVRQQPSAAARSLSGATSDELGETASGWRILVADDHRINTMFASRLLQKSGHVVATVSNGAEAVDYVLKNRPDIVLMDIQMPVKDGLQAIAQIRQHEAGSGDHVPIVALTAHAMNGYDEKCFAAGADAYLAKPLKSAELHDVMQQLLNQSQYAADSESADDAVTESDDRSAATFEPVEDVISPQAIRQNTEDDADFAQVLINVFREDLGKMIEQLDAAIREEDVETVARLAHSFKSPLDFFGAEQVRDQSHHLEKLAKAREFPQLRPEFQRLRVGLQQVDHALSTYGLDN